MMVQSHVNDRFNIFLCDFQLRTEIFYYIYSFINKYKNNALA